MNIYEGIGKELGTILEIVERNHSVAKEQYQELKNKITAVMAYLIEAQKELAEQQEQPEKKGE